jgi:hypothetical protein
VLESYFSLALPQQHAATLDKVKTAQLLFMIGLWAYSTIEAKSAATGTIGKASPS